MLTLANDLVKTFSGANPLLECLRVITISLTGKIVT